MTTIVTDKQQLVAKTNNKLTGLALNGSFSQLLGLKQPSLSSSCLQERVNEGHGQRFVGMAKNFARVHLAQHLPSSNPGHAPAMHLQMIFVDQSVFWRCMLGIMANWLLCGAVQVRKTEPDSPSPSRNGNPANCVMSALIISLAKKSWQRYCLFIDS